jgi:hypothetical protein
MPVYGNMIRFKMRDATGGSNYLSMRKVHKPLGILIYLLTKAKFYYLHEVEHHDKIMFPEFDFDLRLIFGFYLLVLVIFWTFMNLLLINKPNRFRHRVMKDNTGFFSTAQKSAHSKLLDLKSDGTVRAA